MVVISAAVLSKTGRTLLARNFIPVSKNRMEGYLQSFPKLVGSDSQHTFIETENIRYVYQPMETLYVILLTNKQSNIMEDLDTLRLFAKLIPDYCGGINEEAVVARSYELCFAVDELLTHGGYKETVTVAQIKTFTEMDSHEEKLQKIILESKMNDARDQARKKAADIDSHKALMRQHYGFAAKDHFDNSKFGGLEGGASSNARSDSVSSSNHSFDSSPRNDSSNTTSKPAASPAPQKVTESKVKVKGMQLSKAKKGDDFLAQLNKEEKLAPVNVNVPTGPLGSSSSSSAAAAAAATEIKTDHVRVCVEEKLTVHLDRDGGLKKMDIQGEMKLSIYDPDDSKIVVFTNGASKESEGFKFRLHPKIDKNLWAKQGTLGLADPTKGFPVGSDNAPTVLKWRKEKSAEEDVPFTLNFWPNVEDGKTVVSVEFSAEKDIDLQDVIVSIPCGDAPEVTNCSGEWRYDPKAHLLLWRVGTAGPSNSSGSFEFAVSETDSDSFFPIHIDFHSNQTLSGIEAANVVQAQNQEQSVKVLIETQLKVDKYIIE